jgi:homocysteine S-methyltransferase
MANTPDPIQPFLDDQGFLIVDGGLASELERTGFDLDDPLWSARLLLEEPGAIAEVHRQYLEAGADCIISASYQATIEGFIARGLDDRDAEDLIRKAVRLAVEARDGFWADLKSSDGRPRPLVAASVGPYGAYLANGAEFTGDYDLDETGLIDFHRRRWEILCSTGADLLACETIPSAAEARALARLLSESAGRSAWFSFSCRDGEHINDGTPIAECVREISTTDGLVAVGVNCTPPAYVTSLVETVREVTDLPIVVYPNSGESWDPDKKEWTGAADPIAFALASRGWFEAGARLLGGCCRTRPRDIRGLRDILPG